MKPEWLNVHTTLDTVRENVATLRPSLVKLCNGNYCAAMILDDLYYQAYSRYSYRSASRDRDEQNNLEVTTNIPQLINMMANMFDEQAVLNALTIIADKGYINFEISQDFVTYEFFHKFMDHDLEILKGNTPPPVVYTPAKTTPTPDKVVDEIKNTPKIPRRSESRRVEYHNNRAFRVGLPASLTTKQWLQTLDYFGWKCALCPDGAYEVLEHFIPLIQGGGTTEYNCIPACTQCNRIKHDTHPSMIPVDLAIYQSLQEVQKYLESRRMNVEAEQ